MGKEEEAIYLIRMAADMSKRYYGKPFVCTYSGGKDSDVVLELCKQRYNRPLPPEREGGCESYYIVVRCRCVGFYKGE